MDDFTKQFGARIRKRRKELGMTQEELAEKTGYTNRFSISKIEAGERRTRQDKIPLFAKALDLPLPVLLGEDDVKKDDKPRGRSNPALFENRIPVLHLDQYGNPVYTYEQTDDKARPDFVVSVWDSSMSFDFPKKKTIIYCRKASSPLGYPYSDKIYVVVYKNRLFLRRIAFDPKSGAMLMIPSNTEYPIESLSLDEQDQVQIVGYALGYGALTD